MNLDKLKELEARVTQGEITSFEIRNGVLMIEINGKFDYVTIGDTKLHIALRNSAKEIFSTIERYKTALEKIQESHGFFRGRIDDYVSGRIKGIKLMAEIAGKALKEPEKTGD